MIYPINFIRKLVINILFEKKIRIPESPRGSRSMFRTGIGAGSGIGFDDWGGIPLPGLEVTRCLSQYFSCEHRTDCEKLVNRVTVVYLDQSI